jgi:hypothetical protein
MKVRKERPRGFKTRPGGSSEPPEPPLSVSPCRGHPEAEALERGDELPLADRATPVSVGGAKEVRRRLYPVVYTCLFFAYLKVRVQCYDVKLDR